MAISYIENTYLIKNPFCGAKTSWYTTRRKCSNLSFTIPTESKEFDWTSYVYLFSRYSKRLKGIPRPFSDPKEPWSSLYLPSNALLFLINRKQTNKLRSCLITLYWALLGASVFFFTSRFDNSKLSGEVDALSTTSVTSALSSTESSTVPKAVCLLPSIGN